jgi:hypothetical protein
MIMLEEIAGIAGISLLIGGVFAAAYTLLFRTIDVKRVIAFAVILFFCGSFLVLYGRIEQVELATIGKITVQQAKADAKEIRDIRIQMQQQQQAMLDLVKDMKRTANQVSILANDVAKDIFILQQSQKANQKQNLLRHIEIVNKTIRSLESERQGILGKPESGRNIKQMILYEEILKEREKHERLQQELRLLEEGKKDIQVEGIDEQGESSSTGSQ